MKKSTHLDDMPGQIMSRIQNYSANNGRKLPVVKVLKLSRDYIATIRYIYPHTVDKALNRFVGKVDERIVNYIAEQVKGENGVVVLADIPRIELEYKAIDNEAIAYRYRYFHNDFITEWKIRKSRSHIRTDIGKEAFQIVKSIWEKANEIT